MWAFHSLGESEIGQVLEEVGCVGIGEAPQVIVEVAEQTKVLELRIRGLTKSVMVLLTLVHGPWGPGVVDQGAAQGVVGGDEAFEGHVAGGAFRGGGALDGFFEDEGYSASRSLGPVLSCDPVSGGGLLWQ